MTTENKGKNLAEYSIALVQVLGHPVAGLSDSKRDDSGGTGDLYQDPLLRSTFTARCRGMLGSSRKLLGIRYEAATRWLHKYSALTADAEGKSSEFVVPKMEKLQSLLKKSTPDRAGDEKRQDEITPYSPPAGDEGTGSPECQVCLGEGRVPVFEDQDGLSMPVGYRPCECVAEE